MGFDISNFDDALDYVVSMIGSDFEKTMQMANAIIAEPQNYTGPQAAYAAQKLAAHRYRIGVASKYWQTKAVKEVGGNRTDQMVKNALTISYDALTEVINTLKITARHDHQLAQSTGSSQYRPEGE